LAFTALPALAMLSGITQAQERSVTAGTAGLNFGQVQRTGSGVLPVTITNHNVAQTVTFNAEITHYDGRPARSYSILTDAQNTCMAGIRFGQSCTLPIEFSPRFTGNHDSVLSVTPSTGKGFTVALSGYSGPVNDYTLFQLLFVFNGHFQRPVDISSVIFDAQGNRYGTTSLLGSYNNGSVFEVSRGVETVLYSFTGGDDGANPAGPLVQDALGNFYGTTYQGGTAGAGVVFKLDPFGNETVLHSFTGGDTDGKNPLAGLLMDTHGNLYGTTPYGGPANAGTVFKIDPSGTETVLHFFHGRSNGANPEHGLVMDAAGNLYGVTALGGLANVGTIFKIDNTGMKTTLYSFFGDRADGAIPSGPLSLDAAGNLYGATSQGGKMSKGTIFRLTPAGAEQIVYNFGSSGPADGANPSGSLALDQWGHVFGTTINGGSGGGTVFEIDNTGFETVIYSFQIGSCGCWPEGAFPLQGLVTDGRKRLYGTTTNGGGGLFRLSHQ
jgi:uncharacterized repeat protein (TIGR03803 family)